MPAFVFLLAAILALLTGSASAQSLPPGWAGADIGAVGTAGSSSVTGSTFTVSGGGADIWGTADAFRFAYVMLTGDGSITVRVASVQPVHDWTKAGVMLRATLAPGSAQASMFVSPGKGLAFQRRVSAGGLSTHTSGGAGRAPVFVRMSRVGNVFTASISSDGSNWVVVGAETIAMPATIYAGFAVGSHISGVLAAATFETWTLNGSFTPVGQPPPPPAVPQTLVFFRHGEKPEGGFGQITCQGLQRALALPAVLASRFGTPHRLFAPNPSPKVGDPAGSFYYVRPLATIEPTAIRLGLPVHAGFGFSDVAGLQQELLGGATAGMVTFVSWEHAKLVEVVQNIMNAYGSGVTVPAWTYGDYDSFYIVRITTAGGTVTAQFERDCQGLNNLPAACP